MELFQIALGLTKSENEQQSTTNSSKSKGLSETLHSSGLIINGLEVLLLLLSHTVQIYGS